MRKTYIGAVAIAVAAFLWAVDGVVLTPWIMSLGLSDVPIFVFMLHLVGSVFLSFVFFKKREELKKLNTKDWIAFGLVGLFGGALGTMGIVGAILYVYAHGLNIAVVLLLQKLQPLFAILLAIILLKEHPRGRFYLWAVVALVGSYFLTFGFEKPHIGTSGMFVPGILALLAAFSFGSSTVFSKFAVTKVSHLTGTMLRFFMTTFVMAVIIGLVSVFNYIGIDTTYAGFAGFEILTWEIIGGFIVVALTTGIFGIFIYYYGLKRVSASRSTIYELVFPLSSIFLEWFIHGNVLNSGQWFGTILLLSAIYIIARSQYTYEKNN